MGATDIASPVANEKAQLNPSAALSRALRRGDGACAIATDCRVFGMMQL